MSLPPGGSLSRRFISLVFSRIWIVEVGSQGENLRKLGIEGD
jgi:hypothetical protein